jgi:hypothetical protein
MPDYVYAMFGVTPDGTQEGLVVFEDADGFVPLTTDRRPKLAHCRPIARDSQGIPVVVQTAGLVRLRRLSKAEYAERTKR